jgi:hypothetical protein
MRGFFIAVLSIAGVLAVPSVLFRIWKQFWIEAQGVITAVKIRAKRNAEKKKIKTFDIQYEYLASGRRFRGADSVDIDVPYYEENEVVAELAENYKPGDLIAVYHPASTPQLSALRRTVGLDKIFYAIGFLVIVAMGYYVYFAGAFASMDDQPNKAPQSTTTAVTPPAGQEARQP